MYKVFDRGKAGLPLASKLLNTGGKKEKRKTDRTERYFQPVHVRRMWLEIRPSKECLEV